MEYDFIFYDLAARKSSSEPDLVFPGWKPDDERVIIFSPHDDDALLGAGLLIHAARAFSGQVKIIIFCDGRAGYSKIEDKPDIVPRRKQETLKAYGRLGLGPDDIICLDLPDFSAPHYLGWALPHGGEGLFGKLVPMMRERRVTRLVMPNGFREHIDHTAAHLAGAFFGPQVGDAIVCDWGEAEPLRSMLVYSVWGDFPPDGAIITGRDTSIRADLAITADERLESEIMEALGEFASQEQVISGLVQAHRQRIRKGRIMELYMSFDPRPRLNYDPYWDALQKIV